MHPPESEQLAEAFATLARELEAAGPEERQALITRFAVEHVPGCAHAAISLLRRNGRVTTAAATDDIAAQITTIQHEVKQGPGLSALTDHNVVRVDDLARDQRWPRFTRRVTAEVPVASLLSIRLYTSKNTTGALDLYAAHPHTFDARSRGIGTILGAHAALAIAAAREHRHAENLEAALENSRTIGTAIGIVMCTQQLTRGQAFNFLVDVSQRLNAKLHDLAEVIADTGTIPDRFGNHSP